MHTFNYLIYEFVIFYMSPNAFILGHCLIIYNNVGRSLKIRLQ
jgi:hypothetical protein